MQAASLPWEPYVIEGGKTTQMLAECSEEPLPFSDHFRLMSHGLSRMTPRSLLGRQGSALLGGAIRLRLLKPMVWTCGSGELPEPQADPIRGRRGSR
jgi:hypothetical protein